MAKPEVLRSVRLGRAKRRVFEAKESSISQIAKRSRTGGIATFVDHHTPTTSLRIEAPPMRLVSVPESAQILVGYADLQRLGSPALVQFVCSLPLVMHRVNARN